jgi:hypothetical protein
MKLGRNGQRINYPWNLFGQPTSKDFQARKDKTEHPQEWIRRISTGIIQK